MFLQMIDEGRTAFDAAGGRNSFNIERGVRNRHKFTWMCNHVEGIDMLQGGHEFPCDVEYMKRDLQKRSCSC